MSGIALIILGVDPMRRYKYTDQELIKNLKDTARRLGRTPKRREIKNPGSWVYIKRFGSWNKAFKAAGQFL